MFCGFSVISYIYCKIKKTNIREHPLTVLTAYLFANSNISISLPKCALSLNFVSSTLCANSKNSFEEDSGGER